MGNKKQKGFPPAPRMPSENDSQFNEFRGFFLNSISTHIYTLPHPLKSNKNLCVCDIIRCVHFKQNKTGIQHFQKYHYYSNADD